MISKVEALVRRMRFKVYFYEHPDMISDQKDNFGFKSTKAPPQSPSLAPFESDIYELIRSIQFKPVKSNFQKQLSKDIKEFKKSEKIYVSADKTANIYIYI